MKQKISEIVTWALVSLMVPYLITLFWTGQVEKLPSELKYSGKQVTLENDSMDLENFLIYMVASQIDIYSEKEAIKAQVALARTYLYKKVGDLVSVNADQLETTYLTIGELKSLWGDQFTLNYKKLESAVSETAGVTVTYNGAYIDAVFHRASAGKTRDGGEERPYLKPVDSNDVEAESFLTMRDWTPENFKQAIDKVDPNRMISTENLADTIQIIEREEGGYVQSLQIGGQVFTGDEAADALELNSTCFFVESYEGKIRVITKGIGHGYGLSQEGACRMAENGSTYKEIISYYFNEVEIQSEF